MSKSFLAPLMDGKADANRIMLVDLTAEELANSLKLFLIPVEDLIADRMGQSLAGLRIEESMKNQAVMLYRLTEALDKTYLDRRIREETGNDASLQVLEEWTKDATDLA